MKLSIEMKSVHDLVLLDTLIDAWKAKWKADEAELKGANDDADDESEDSHIATPEEVAEFVRNLRPSDLKKYETVGKAIEDLQNALSIVGLKFSGALHIDDADGCDDRS